MMNSKCKHCGDPKKGHYAGPAKCKNCGRPEEECDADVLLKMIENGKKPDMNKFNALIKAGAPIRTTVRTKDVGVT